PRLEAVVDLAGQLGLAINLEIKEGEVAIAQAISRLTLPEGSSVSSFLLAALDQVAAVAPRVRRSLLSVGGGVEEARRHHGWNPFFRSVVAEPEALAAARRAGLEVAVWTVDEP